MVRPRVEGSGKRSGKRGAETAREAQGARSGQWSLHVSFQREAWLDDVSLKVVH